MRKMYSKKQIEGMIEGKDDIISQIKVEYDGNSLTNFIFPKGIIPLSIRLNDTDLYFKDFNLVNENGITPDGYTFDDFTNEAGNMILSIVGDLSNQTINAISYIRFCGISQIPIKNTYKIFFGK